MGATLASATFYSEDAASPQTAALPASTASGDLLVYAIAQGDSTIANLTAPSGWTTVSSANGGSVTGKVFQKVATGSEPGTYDFPYSAGADVAAVMIRVTGEDTTPTIVQAVGTAGPLAGVVDSPTVTPTGVDDLLVVIMSAACGGTTLSKTYPTGTTGLGQGQVAGGFQALTAAYQQLVSSAATGAKTWTGITPATKPGVTFSLAIASASAGGAAPAFVSGQPTRRRPTLRPFRARMSTPVRAQVNPPFPVGGFIDPPRRLRGLLARRPRISQPVPAQVVVTAPAYPPAPERARLKGLRLFRPRASSPVPPQVTVVPPAYPPQSVRTRLRGLRLFRPHAAAPVPAQVILTAPAYPPSGLRARIRGLRLFRGHAVVAPPPQVVLAAPSYVPRPSRERLQQPLARRRTAARPPAEQLGPPPAEQRSRFRMRPVRGRVSAPPPQQERPPLVLRVRARLVKVWRGHAASPVPAQVVLIAPARAPQATRARRSQFAARRHRGGFDGWLVPGVVTVCVVPRPSTGLVGRGSTGTAVRPNTGTVEFCTCCT